MKQILEILNKIGINDTANTIFEYESIQIDWWDKAYRTSIEIEVQELEPNNYLLAIVFCPDIQGLVERALIYSAAITGNKLVKKTQIAKLVFENISSELSLSYEEEQNLYSTNSFNDSKEILERIIGLIGNKTPILKFNIGEPDDEIESEPGDTLDHFLGMLCINSTIINEQNLKGSLAMLLDLEGEEYLENLKIDAESNFKAEFIEEYEIEEAQVTLIKDMIINYSA